MTKHQNWLILLWTSLVKLTFIIAPNFPSKTRGEMKLLAQLGRQYKNQRNIYTYHGSFLVYRTVPAFPRTSHTAVVLALLPVIVATCKLKRQLSDSQHRMQTMARWKSGLLLVVSANSVNCETQRMSPSISLTLVRHIFRGSEGSENTRRLRLSN